MNVDLATRAELADLNARVAWALDLCDWDALREALAHDVHYVGAAGEFHDAEAVVASFRARPRTRTTRHGLGNLLLSSRADGTVIGRSSWHTFASNALPAGGVPLFMVADFHDTYTRDPHGSWRITERIILPVFRDDTLAPPTPGAAR